MNQVKTRLQSLGLVDRALASTDDAELIAARDRLTDDHREALAQVVGVAPDAEPSAEQIRAATQRGRLDGTLESVSLVLTDACLAQCIDELGEAADHPSSDQLREVLPNLVRDHGIGITRLMLAVTVLGEAPAAAIIRDLLKHDELVALPPPAERPAVPLVTSAPTDDAERAALKAKRQEQKRKKQAEARQRREQAQRAKRKR